MSSLFHGADSQQKLLSKVTPDITTFSACALRRNVVIFRRSIYIVDPFPAFSAYFRLVVVLLLWNLQMVHCGSSRQPPSRQKRRLSLTRWAWSSASSLPLRQFNEWHTYIQIHPCGRCWSSFLLMWVWSSHNDVSVQDIILMFVPSSRVEEGIPCCGDDWCRWVADKEENWGLALWWLWVSPMFDVSRMIDRRDHSVWRWPRRYEIRLWRWSETSST